jgi:Family of unknown function (DUF6535)
MPPIKQVSRYWCDSSHSLIHGFAGRDEPASAKLWAVYISEAEKYDKALVEGWKSDMEGLLIFVRADST